VEAGKEAEEEKIMILTVCTVKATVTLAVVQDRYSTCLKYENCLLTGFFGFSRIRTSIDTDRRIDAIILDKFCMAIRAEGACFALGFLTGNGPEKTSS
jgi:hypothetical protein